MESQLSLFQVEDKTSSLTDIRTEQQASKKISYDAGVKIGGSRKDIAALRKAFQENQSISTLDDMEDFNPILAAEMITKQELLLSKFSLEQEKENGTEPCVAKAKLLLIQRVDITPKVDSKESRLQFMNAAQSLLSFLEPVRMMDDLYSVLNEIAGLIRRENNSIPYYQNRLKEITAVLETLEKESEDWNRLVQKEISFKNHIKDTQKAQELRLSSLGKKFCNFFKSQSSYRSTLSNALNIESWDELLTKKEKKSSTTRTPVWERSLPERPDRVGGGQSIIEKPEDLLSFFGFRGVEFGHYMDDSKGMEHLLRSSEAMMDLAELLGFGYHAISLKGTLAMSYGARGRGGNAYATYEPFSKVINMTKEKGCLGVFSHEWFHSLDNYLFDVSHHSKNGRRSYVSELEDIGPYLHSELISLFKDLMEVIKKGNSVGYYENTNQPGQSWRGTTFKQAYKRHNGDLYKAMEEKVEMEQKSLESSLRFYSSLSYYTDKDVEKVKKRQEKNNKSFAQALAWFHEQQTGERVDQIPYPSGMSNYMQAALVLDKQKNGKYWTSNCELAARAFESYIQDKLKDCSRKSDYLVAGTRDGAAFPMGEERQAINQKFEEIIQLIKELKLI